jgi:hypothetical protein
MNSPYPPLISIPGTSVSLKKSMNSVLGPAAKRGALAKRRTRSACGKPVESAGRGSG